MLGYEHLITSVGIVETAVTFGNNPVSNHPLLLGHLLVGVALGSLLPDIDHPKSTISKLLPPLRWSFILTKHRGITHSLAFLIGLGVIGLMICKMAQMGLYGQYTAIGIWIGYFLHLLEDSFSKQGIAWLYPITKPHKNKFGYRTGGMFTKLVTWMGLVSLIVDVIMNLDKII